MSTQQMYKSKHINRLPLNENSSTYLIIETHWDDDDIKIRLLECDDSTTDLKEWHGIFTKTKLVEFSDQYEIPYDKFREETRIALSTNNGQSGFIYTITDESKFVWKKKIDSLKLIYGACDLEQCSNIKNDILLNSLAIIDGLRGELDSHSSELADFQKTHESFVERFEKLIEEKTKYEDDLLTKFLLLLNTKKQKIADLQDLLNEKNAQKQIVARKQILSDSDSTIIDSQETLIDEELCSMTTDIPPLKRKNSEDSSQSQEINLHVPKRTGTIIQSTTVNNVIKNKPNVSMENTTKKVENEPENMENDDDKFDVDTQEFIDNL